MRPVIKLGGSMMRSPQLLPWLKAARTGGAILVTGGGDFANTVRTAQADMDLTDETAHHMAILAMLQFGMVCCDLMPEMKMFQTLQQAKELIKQKQTPVWDPQHMTSKWHDLPHDWSATADTLALRLAAAAGASRLILVKAGAKGTNNDATLLDQAFARQHAAHGKNIKATCHGPDEHGRIAAELGSRNSGAARAVPRKIRA